MQRTGWTMQDKGRGGRWGGMLFGVLIVIWGIYLFGISLRVTAGRRGLEAVRGVFDLHLARHAVADEIATIDKVIGMQTRQGNRSQAWYRIQAHTRDGRHITLGAGITGASHVEALAERLRTALGLAGQADGGQRAEGRVIA